MSGTFQLFDALPAHIEDALRASIERFGVLVPVTVDQNGMMLDGHHRARIADQLGVSYDRLIRRCEDDEERREIARTLNADRRQLNDDQRRAVAVDLREKGHSLRAIASALGVSAPTIMRDLEREEIVTGETISQPERVTRQGGGSYPARRPQVLARDDDEQQRAQAALVQIGADTPGERTLSVVEARQLAARQRAPEPAGVVELPEGRFQCIVIDPPWPIKKIETMRRPDQGVELDYPTMSLEEIAAVPVGDKAADDCHLYLWVTHKYLPAGLALMEGWGFRYQCVMTWWKHTGMSPYSWMYDTEHVLFGSRGNLPLQKLGMRLFFDAPNTRNRHSKKPDVFYERVLAASPEPRLEMFAREARDGFTVWGNEVAG